MDNTIITSDYIVPNIEQHLKVSAGPGAGKTRWLINHIKNILTRSTRLGKTRTIACLTYSNIAVDTIKERLGTSAQQVEVSTIHSFLYKHIVKPYAFAVAYEYNLDVAKMDGHDEEKHYKLQDWINKDFSLNYLSENRDFAIECLKKQQWVFVNGDLRRQIIVIDEQDKRKEKFLKNDKHKKYLNYKKLYWQEGTLSHDDVLFFSYQIVTKYPFVLEVLRAKFPYFLIDEFQDTSPIQTAILKLLTEKETIVGVIGDPAQSIYGFQGADEKQLESFTLPNMQTYNIADNHRSTIQIIDLLNHIRKDMPQNPSKDENGNDKNGEKPILYVGDREEALKKIKEAVGDDFTLLAYKNDTVTAIQHQQTGKSEDLFDLLKADNDDRRRWIEACIKAVVLAQNKKFKDAIQEFVRLYRRYELKRTSKITEEMRFLWHKDALENIIILLSNYKTIVGSTLKGFSDNYLTVNKSIKVLITATEKGNVIEKSISFITKEKDCHQKIFGDYMKCVNVKEDTGNFRTIHKAKGAEFDNVVVVLDKEEEIMFLTKPDLSKEEQRIRYVAVSRAKKRLFIQIDRFNGSLSNYICAKYV